VKSKKILSKKFVLKTIINYNTRHGISNSYTIMIKTVLFDYAGVITPTKNNFIFATNNSKRFGLTPKELMQMTYENWGDTALGKQKDSDFWNQIANKLQ